MIIKIKVYELAKDLGQDTSDFVDVIQRLGIDVKNVMSVLGTEEVRIIREHFKKSKSAQATKDSKSSSGSVTELRVGATVIRRRTRVTEDQKLPIKTELLSEADDRAEAGQQEEVRVEPSAPSEVSTPVSDHDTELKAGNKIKKPQPIIRKVATEEYLGEVVGPKPQTSTPSKNGIAEPTTPSKLPSKKVVKEVELVQVVPARDGRRRVMQRQDVVFRSSDYLKRELVQLTKRKKSVPNRPALKTIVTTPADHKRIVEMGSTILVSELGKSMGVKGTSIIKKLLEMGVTATLNQLIDYDTAVLVAHEFKYELKQRLFKEEAFVKAVDVSPEQVKPRPPVVTIMGHVDHGKTSLLDTIRKTKVASGEAGGITQHIGAYTIGVSNGKVTFIDTPGHEAFTAMRARGAKVTDIVVLVVSATDGVMPQTIESINHAKAANVPVIVAINKVDLPEAQPERAKQTLTGYGLTPEEWGGETIFVNVSAKTGLGVDKLLESILLQAELLELKANYETAARGVVIESKLDKTRGPIGTVLLQHGTLHKGDIAVTGVCLGKIRSLQNWHGEKVQSVTPGEAAEIMGLSSVPNVGEELIVFEKEDLARDLVKNRTEKFKIAAEQKPKVTLEQVLATPSEEKELNVILKTDVQGSAEALREALNSLPQDKVKLRVLHSATGGITESDVMLGAASSAILVGFNVRPDVKAQKLADVEKVQIRTYDVIYNMVDDIRKGLEGLISPQIMEKLIGRAEVRNVFHVPKVGTIAGSSVTDGKVIRGCYLRLLRDSRIIFEGRISSLRRFKDDVKEVAQGFECGIGIENFNDIKMGDQLEAFLKEEVRGTL